MAVLSEVAALRLQGMSSCAAFLLANLDFRGLSDPYVMYGCQEVPTQRDLVNTMYTLVLDCFEIIWWIFHSARPLAFDTGVEKLETLSRLMSHRKE